MEHDHDIKQDALIDQLKEADKDNRKTDSLQWAALVIAALAGIIYISIVCLGIIQSQSKTVQALIEKCGK